MVKHQTRGKRKENNTWQQGGKLLLGTIVQIFLGQINAGAFGQLTPISLSVHVQKLLHHKLKR